LIIRLLADDGFTSLASDIVLHILFEFRSKVLICIQVAATGLEIDPAIPERKLALLVSSHDQNQEQNEPMGEDPEKPDLEVIREIVFFSVHE
jgi:hypothetical protein